MSEVETNEAHALASVNDWQSFIAPPNSRLVHVDTRTHDVTGDVYVRFVTASENVPSTIDKNEYWTADRYAVRIAGGPGQATNARLVLRTQDGVTVWLVGPTPTTVRFNQNGQVEQPPMSVEF